MAEMVIDLSNYKDRFGSRVPEGNYLVQIEDIESDKSKAGNAMLVVSMRIIGGEQDGANLIDRLTLSDKAMFRVVAFLNGLGIKTPRKKIRIDPQRILGKKVRVDVADGEPFNGTVRSEIKAYIRVASSGSESDAGDDLDALDMDTETVDESTPKKEKKAKKSKKEKKAAEPSDTSDDGELDLDQIEV